MGHKPEAQPERVIRLWKAYDAWRRSGAQQWNAPVRTLEQVAGDMLRQFLVSECPVLVEMNAQHVLQPAYGMRTSSCLGLTLTSISMGWSGSVAGSDCYPCAHLPEVGSLAVRHSLIPDLRQPFMCVVCVVSDVQGGIIAYLAAATRLRPGRPSTANHRSWSKWQSIAVHHFRRLVPNVSRVVRTLVDQARCGFESCSNPCSNEQTLLDTYRN